MPLFYFNIRDAGTLIEDQEGSVLPDLIAAHAEAEAAARDLVIDLIRAERVLDGQCIEIADATGKLVASVPLKSSVIEH